MEQQNDYQWATPLLSEIADFIRTGEEDTNRLKDLSLQLARLQYENIELVRRLAEMRGWTPENAAELEKLPAIPTDVFKKMEMHSAPETVTHRFMTSGTSKSEANRGTCLYSADDMALMNISIRQNAVQHLFPDFENKKWLILVMAPSPTMAPHMIMAYGMNQLIQHFGLPESGFLLGKEGLEVPKLIGHLKQSCEAGTPVALIGASFGFVHLLEGISEKNLKFQLPQGSRILHAGGFKGKSKTVVSGARG